MARLNLRLTCSLLAVGAVLLLSLWPGTRTLAERQFWILSGVYEKRVGLAADEYVGPQGGDDDERIVTLLKGFNKIPVEARAFELAGIASRRKDPALWAHVILQTSMSTVPTKHNDNATEAEMLRPHTIGQIELTAARAGAALDPDNAFFALAEATALAKQERWKEVPPILIALKDKTRYEDYIFDQFRRRIEALHKSLKVMLRSDYGRDWASLLFPHLTNFKSLTRLLPDISADIRDRAAFGLAHAGTLLEKYPDIRITRMVGTAIVAASVRDRSKAEEKDTIQKRDGLHPDIDRFIERARAAGAADLEAGWKSLANWKKPDYAFPEMPTDIPATSEPMNGVSALYVLLMVGALAAALWVGAQIEPSAQKILNLGLILIGMEICASLSVERFALLGSLLAASTMLFMAFLLVRLPGKERSGYILAIAALALATLPSLFASDQLPFPALLTTVWAFPFAISRFVKKSMPRWTAIGLSTLFFAGSFWMVGTGQSGSAIDFGRHLTDLITMSAALAVFWIPLLVAMIMATAKLNFQETLKVVAVPLPLFALIASGVFVWNIRDQVKMEKVWTTLSAQELPERYRKVLADAEIPLPDEEVQRYESEHLVAPVATTP